MTRFLTLLLSTFVFSGAAHAADHGYYVNASVGLNLLGDRDIDIVFNDTPSSGEASYNGSFGAGAAFGYQYNDRISAEVEFLYRRADLDSVDLGAFGSFDEGDFANTQFSVAGFYHFDIPSSERWSAYVGAGVAYIQEIDIDFETDGEETSFETDEFGLELHGGVRYALNDRAFIDAGIRYTNVSDVEMEFEDNAANTATADYDPLLLSLKFGWRF